MFEHWPKIAGDAFGELPSSQRLGVFSQLPQGGFGILVARIAST
jgi:hypothetical protein